MNWLLSLFWPHSAKSAKPDPADPLPLGGGWSIRLVPVGVVAADGQIAGVVLLKALVPPRAGKAWLVTDRLPAWRSEPSDN